MRGAFFQSYDSRFLTLDSCLLGTEIMMTTRSLNKPHRRNAFTLIELLIVIAIIGILIGFLVPAVAGAMKRARVVSVKAEISQLETAIGKFRSVYNMDPPSSITLYETAAGWNLAAAVNHRATIRQLWPQFDFTYSSYASNQRDFNGDGSYTSVTLLRGECLVFFLGGINSTNAPGVANIGACTGFSKNPVDPFFRGGNREPFFFEFLPARFTDLNNNGFPEYRDPLPSQTTPYLYYSGYDGTAYQSTEFFASSSSDPDQTGPSDLTRTGLSEPYRTGTALAAPLWKPNSYQIISPGYDRAYGFGGAYVASGTDRLAFVATVYTGATPTALVPPTDDQRKREADNITNFSAGELQP